MIDLENALHDWFMKAAVFDEWASPYAVTLPMRQTSFFQVPLDVSGASANLSEFLEFLHEEFFSGDDLSKETRLRCIPVLERGELFRYRLCLEKPAHISEASFMEQVANCWWATDFAHWDVEIKRVDADWIGYLAKLQSASEAPDALDWDNYWNPG